MGQMGFFDVANRSAGLDAKNDPLARLDALVPWEQFRGERSGSATVLVCQAESVACHGVWLRRMALRMTSSLRMQAVSASLAGLPARRRRS